MEYIQHLIYGFFMAFFGLIAPGMLNMTAVRTAIEVSRREAVKFSLGAASIVFPQALIALVFANYFIEHPAILSKLTIAAIGVFFGLCILFYVQATRKIEYKGKRMQGNQLLMGALMSLMNMLAIPFYLGLSTYLESKGLLIMEIPFILFFVTGASLGAFSLFIVYVQFSKIIIKRAQFIARNINFILSGLFLILGIISLVKILT